MARFRALAVFVLFTVLAVLAAPPSANAQESADNAAPEVERVTATAQSQRYQEGEGGTVVTLTDLETADGETITVETDGGIRSDGIGQHTSHEAEFTVGETYALELVAEVGVAARELNAEGAANPTVRHVAGGEKGLTRVDANGRAVAERNLNPDNFVLLPFDWNWTLPQNPPQFLINANTPDIGNETSLITEALTMWTGDVASSMLWSVGGTTTSTAVADDGQNSIFWADTPNAADDFLARATTFYEVATGRAVDTDIQFNNDYTWVDGATPGAFDVGSVALHEAGHSLGLDHALNEPAIMYFELADNTVKRGLSAGDRGGLRAIYPNGVTGPVVSGRVTWESASFTGELGASGIRLNLFTENRAQFLGATDSDASGGFYNFDLPGAGCYVMTFIAPTDRSFTASGGRFLNQPFCAGANEILNNIDGELQVPGNETTTAGQVTTSDGNASEGIKLNFFTQNRASFLGFAITDGSGGYSFNLPGGGCYVTTFIAPDGASFEGSGLNRFFNRAYCVDQGGASDAIDAVFLPAQLDTGLSGQITDSAGASVSGVKIVLYRANGDGSRGQWLGPAFSDGSGNYGFTPGPGCYVMDLVAPDGRTWAVTGGPFQRLAACVEAGQNNTSLDATLN